MDGLAELTEALKELGDSLRRVGLSLGFLAIRMSTAGSDTVVIRVPRGLRRFKSEAPTAN